MVAKTRSAQEGVGVGVVDGVVDGVGDGVAADPHAEQAATSSRRIAASRPRCILHITQNSLLSLFRVRHRASPRQASGKSPSGITSRPWMRDRPPGKGAWGKGK